MSTIQAGTDMNGRVPGLAGAEPSGDLLPEIGTFWRMLIGGASALIVLWAAVGIVLALLLPERAAWTFVGFEFVAMVAGAVGVPFLFTNAYKTGPAIAAVSIAGAIGASAVLGALGVSWRLGTFSVTTWTLGRVGVAALLALAASWIIVARMGTLRTLLAGIVMFLPVLCAASALWIHGGRFDAVGMPLAKEPPPAPTESAGPADVFNAGAVSESVVELSGSRRSLGLALSYGAAVTLVPLVALAGVVLLSRSANGTGERDLGTSLLAASGLMVWPAAVVALYLVTDGRVLSALPGTQDALRQALLAVSAVGALILVCAGGHMCIRAFEGRATNVK